MKDTQKSARRTVTGEAYEGFTDGEREVSGAGVGGLGSIESPALARGRDDLRLG